jgi:hypothetical protein
VILFVANCYFNTHGEQIVAKSKSSRRWLAEHFDDQYVKKAQQQGLRARAAFKLTELDDKYNLIRPGMRVVDLGSAPGSWSQVVQRAMGKSGQIIALDILPMDPIEHVTFIWHPICLGWVRLISPVRCTWRNWHSSLQNNGWPRVEASL